MNELEPRKVVGAGLLAVGFSLIVLALFAAAPSTAWAQKDADQRGVPEKAPAAAPQAPAVSCQFLYLFIKDGDQAGVDQLTKHINKACNPAYAMSMMPVAVTSVTDAPSGSVVCCVPK